MKVQVIGTTPLPYGMLYHNVGKILEMPDKDALILTKIGRVKPLTARQRSRRVYRRRDMTAEQTEQTVQNGEE